MNLGIRVVDAFAQRAFTGNPAGVCILAKALDAKVMQSIALEVNAAETAFLVKNGEDYDLRWFTPLAEIDLCGHATLASAHVLLTEGYASPDKMIKFNTRSGVLTAKRLGDGWIQLDFPAVASAKTTEIDSVKAALGVVPKSLLRTRVDYLVELNSEREVREFTANLPAIQALGTQGVIITAKAGGQYDFVSRYFAPNVGINEDPVTGSAHCALAPYWQSQLGKSEFMAFQASPRGGVLRLKTIGSRVMLEGQAVTTITGEIRVD